MVWEYDLVVYCYTFRLQIRTELQCVNSKLCVASPVYRGMTGYAIVTHCEDRNGDISGKNGVQ